VFCRKRGGLLIGGLSLSVYLVKKLIWIGVAGTSKQEVRRVILDMRKIILSCSVIGIVTKA
jgi:hypothetical protein